MPLVSTPAIVLSALRYSETSKIVRLATRDVGVQSAIAKGALRPRSRFGAAKARRADAHSDQIACRFRTVPPPIFGDRSLTSSAFPRAKCGIDFPFFASLPLPGKRGSRHPFSSICAAALWG